MNIKAKQDPLFEAVKQMVIEKRTPSISLAQRTFRINYSRAASLLEAMEGDVVTTMDEHGMRKMLTGETNDYCVMENTGQQLFPELTISLTTTDVDLMAALSSTVGDFSMVLQVSPNDVMKSTGMVAIPSGVITANDVGRVIEAGMSCLRSIVQASPICHFLVDGNLQTEFMPIGMPAKKLQVSIALLPIPEGMLQRWHGLANALGRNLVGWRIEEVSAHE
ncbi:DNA translocase FtsK [mine drainage metagenome]|uniref:DNA translocase FtsK n=1 Tax=mine drainage metagenome TaxID=410659 RepID=A0A1J5PD95_9ZZZZ